MTDSETMAALAQALGCTPGTPDPYLEALTHGSHANSSTGKDYQRLEFLGDRVLGLAIADLLLRRFPSDPEGHLSARLNMLVSRECCADVARSLGIAPLVRLGKQAREDGGRDSDNILGDVMEALIGALFIDLGFAEAASLIAGWWSPRLADLASAPKHPKSALQEWAAAHQKRPPEYETIGRDGPSHAPRFTVTVRIPKLAEATATGSSKQEAEKDAAVALLRILNP